MIERWKSFIFARNFLLGKGGISRCRAACPRGLGCVASDRAISLWNDRGVHRHISGQCVVDGLRKASGLLNGRRYSPCVRNTKPAPRPRHVSRPRFYPLIILGVKSGQQCSNCTGERRFSRVLRAWSRETGRMRGKSGRAFECSIHDWKQEWRESGVSRLAFSFSPDIIDWALGTLSDISQYFSLP